MRTGNRKRSAADRRQFNSWYCQTIGDRRAQSPSARQVSDTDKMVPDIAVPYHSWLCRRCCCFIFHVDNSQNVMRVCVCVCVGSVRRIWYESSKSSWTYCRVPLFQQRPHGPPQNTRRQYYVYIILHSHNIHSQHRNVCGAIDTNIRRMKSPLYVLREIWLSPLSSHVAIWKKTNQFRWQKIAIDSRDRLRNIAASLCPCDVFQQRDVGLYVLHFCSLGGCYSLSLSLFVRQSHGAVSQKHVIPGTFSSHSNTIVLV